MLQTCLVFYCFILVLCHSRIDWISAFCEWIQSISLRINFLFFQLLKSFLVTLIRNKCAMGAYWAISLLSESRGHLHFDKIWCHSHMLLLTFVSFDHEVFALARHWVVISDLRCCLAIQLYLVTILCICFAHLTQILLKDNLVLILAQWLRVILL